MPDSKSQTKPRRKRWENCVPGKNGILAVLSIMVGAVAAYNCTRIALYDMYTYDLKLYVHQCFSASLAMMGIFHGLGNWFWSSKNLWSRLFTRIHICLVFVISISALIHSRKVFMINYMFHLFDYFNFELMDQSDKDRLSANRLLVNTITVLGATVFLVEAYIVYTKLIIACVRYRLRQHREASMTPATPPRPRSALSFMSSVISVGPKSTPAVSSPSPGKPLSSSTPKSPPKSAKK